MSQAQLNDWMRDSDAWRDGLKYEMFLECFDCELSAMI